MPSAKATPPIYRLKITLVGIEPPIWRALQVPASIKLCCLHSTLQVVMGWKDLHLHRFEKDGKNWGIVQLYDDDRLDALDDDSVTLAEVLKSEGESMAYQYDFGDNRRHDVVLEKIFPAEGAANRPVCLGGERHCPPEDVGGTSGYERFLEVIFDPKHEEYEDLVDWAGGPFQAEEIDLKAVNKTLSRMRWPVRYRR
jgi:Plasmid pRiA4b ORF-3-like protein